MDPKSYSEKFGRSEWLLEQFLERYDSLKAFGFERGLDSKGPFEDEAAREFWSRFVRLMAEQHQAFKAGALPPEIYKVWLKQRRSEFWRFFDVGCRLAAQLKYELSRSGETLDFEGRREMQVSVPHYSSDELELSFSEGAYAHRSPESPPHRVEHPGIELFLLCEEVLELGGDVKGSWNEYYLSVPVPSEASDVAYTTEREKQLMSVIGISLEETAWLCDTPNRLRTVRDFEEQFETACFRMIHRISGNGAPAVLNEVTLALQRQTAFRSAWQMAENTQVLKAFGFVEDFRTVMMSVDPGDIDFVLNRE